jgi:hypothetical protein
MAPKNRKKGGDLIEAVKVIEINERPEKEAKKFEGRRKFLKKIVGKKDGGLMEAIDKVKAAEPTKMREGGQAPKRAGRTMPSRRDFGDEMIETMSPFTGVLRKGDQLRNIDGKTMVIKKVPNPDFVGRAMGESGKMISDADRAMISQIMGARKMENGGQAVPKKFKGFSKLPEDVQMQMDPNLAKKFKFGGKVGGKQMCRGMGIARKSGGFKIT